jgi:hypothetical protein
MIAVKCQNLTLTIVLDGALYDSRQGCPEAFSAAPVSTPAERKRWPFTGEEATKILICID